MATCLEAKEITMINRDEFIRILFQKRKEEIVVCTMTAAREWQTYSDSPLDFTIAGAMGYVSSIGLGLALAQPKRGVLVLDGDGNLPMNLGTLVSVAEHSPFRKRPLRNLRARASGWQWQGEFHWLRSGGGVEGLRVRRIGCGA